MQGSLWHWEKAFRIIAFKPPRLRFSLPPVFSLYSFGKCFGSPKSSEIDILTSALIGNHKASAGAMRGFPRLGGPCGRTARGAKRRRLTLYPLLTPSPALPCSFNAWKMTAASWIFTVSWQDFHQACFYTKDCERDTSHLDGQKADAIKCKRDSVQKVRQIHTATFAGV